MKWNHNVWFHFIVPRLCVIPSPFQTAWMVPTLHMGCKLTFLCVGHAQPGWIPYTEVSFATKKYGIHGFRQKSVILKKASKHPFPWLFIRVGHTWCVWEVNWCSPAPLTGVWVRHKGRKGMKLPKSMDLPNRTTCGSTK